MKNQPYCYELCDQLNAILESLDDLDKAGSLWWKFFTNGHTLAIQKCYCWSERVLHHPKKRQYGF